MTIIFSLLFNVTSNGPVCGLFNDVNCCFTQANKKVTASCDRPTRIWVEYVDKLGRVNMGGVIVDYRVD